MRSFIILVALAYVAISVSGAPADASAAEARQDHEIQDVIDQVWATYDVDKNGALDKQETKKFVQDTLDKLGSGDEFSEEAFDEVFATFDKDGSRIVEQSEMVVYVKHLLGY